MSSSDGRPTREEAIAAAAAIYLEELIRLETERVLADLQLGRERD